MDFADDVAYCVHDVEDGIVAGAIPPNALANRQMRQAVIELALAKPHHLLDAPELLQLAEQSDGLVDDWPGLLEQAAEHLAAQPTWPIPWDASRRAWATLKDLTSQLIGGLAEAATTATRQRYGTGPLARYNANLVVPAAQRAQIAVLKALAAVFVMQPRSREPLYREQQVIISELYHCLLASAPADLEPQFRDDWLQAADDQSRQRVVVDQVACLTDASATLLHRRLTK
jgi:dGTPase